jgi:hypothetical protein
MTKLQSTTKTSKVEIETIQEAQELQAMLLKYGIKVEISK